MKSSGAAGQIGLPHCAGELRNNCFALPTRRSMVRSTALRSDAPPGTHGQKFLDGPDLSPGPIDPRASTLPTRPSDRLLIHHANLQTVRFSGVRWRVFLMDARRDKNNSPGIDSP